MKEIVAIIRRDKLPETKKVLEDLGYPSMSIQSVDGRGKQKGSIFAEMDSEMPDEMPTSVKLKSTPSTYAIEHSLPKAVLYVPKRMITAVVPNDVVDKAVEAIIKANHSGRPGDGKIFVCPVEEAIRVRTGETRTDALL